MSEADVIARLKDVRLDPQDNQRYLKSEFPKSQYGVVPDEDEGENDEEEEDAQDENDDDDEDDEEEKEVIEPIPPAPV